MPYTRYVKKSVSSVKGESQNACSKRDIKAAVARRQSLERRACHEPNKVSQRTKVKEATKSAEITSSIEETPEKRNMKSLTSVHSEESSSIRRSSRSRNVKSARELLGLIPDDKIKKEKDGVKSLQNETKTCSAQTQKGYLTKHINVKKIEITDVVQEQKCESQKTGNNSARDKKKPCVLKLPFHNEKTTPKGVEIDIDSNISQADGKIESVQEKNSLLVENEEMSDTTSSDEKVISVNVEKNMENVATENDVPLREMEEISGTSAPVDTILHIPDTVEINSESTVSYADADTSNVINLDERYLIPSAKTQFSIKKGVDQNIQVVTSSTADDSKVDRIELQVLGENNSLEGLVDPETGHVALPVNCQSDSITSNHEMTSSASFSVQELLDSSKNMQQYIIYNNSDNEITFQECPPRENDDEGPSYPSSKRMRLDADHQDDIDGNEILINLENTELSLVEAEGEDNVMNTIQQIQAAEEAKSKHEDDEMQRISMASVNYVVLDSATGKPYHCPRDETIDPKSKFRTVPLTSEELAAAPRNKNGRCRPQKHVVVAPELQELVNNLQENDFMENHIVAVSDKLKNKYACKYCGEDILNRHQFRKHINSEHKDIDFKPWKCPLCDYSALIKAAIARHINVHSDIKSFTCSECGKGFRFRQKLQIHMKYHDDVRDHKCVLCEMAFHELKTLKMHLLKIHGIEKPKKFIDKYKDKQLTSVLVQLDNSGEPSQGYILPKDSAQTSNTVHNKSSLTGTPKRTSGTGPRVNRITTKNWVNATTVEDLDNENLNQSDNQLDDTGSEEIILPNDGSIVAIEPVHQEMMEEQMQNDEESAQPQVIEILPKKNLLENSNVMQSEENNDYAENETSNQIVQSCETSFDENYVTVNVEEKSNEKIKEINYSEEIHNQSIESKEIDDYNYVNTSVVVDSDTSSIELNNSITYSTEMEGFESNINKKSDNDSEVSVLLPRYRKSTSYGTRKTLLRTSRYKLGLEATDYTPIESNKNKSPNEIHEELKDKEFLSDIQHDEIHEPEALQKESPDHSSQNIKVVNNQKIVSDSQIDDELKKYCQIVTDCDISRIIFICTECPPTDRCLVLDNEIRQDHAQNQFFSKTQFCQHLESAHPDLKPWLCKLCGFRCRMRTSLLAHEKTHEIVKKYECDVCHKRFLFKQKLNVHMRSHTNLRNHVCTACEKGFNEKADLSRHIRRVHESEKSGHNCQFCNKQFRDYQTLEAHINTHDPTKKYVCPYCQGLYRSKGSLAQHMKSHTCMFHCEICNKNFGSYSGFMAHKVMHDQSYEGFECDICKKILHTKGSYARHKTVAHSSERPFECEQCGKGFKTKKDLKNHAFVHTSERAYTCSVCNFSCKRVESLKIHMRRHSEVKPFQCGLCGKEYTQKNSLENHLRHHTGASSTISCNLCGIECSTKYQLKMHMDMRHENFDHDYDEDTDDIMAKLRMGETGDHGVTVFMCEECNSVFLSQDDLAVHILADHMKQGFNTGTGTKVQFRNYGNGPSLHVKSESEEASLSIMDDGQADASITQTDTPMTQELIVGDLNLEHQQPNFVEYVTITNANSEDSVVTVLHPPDEGSQSSSDVKQEQIITDNSSLDELLVDSSGNDDVAVAETVEVVN